MIDEIGSMELKSQHFVSAVEHVLDSDRDMLVVLHHSSRHLLARRTREEFRIITVNEQNRDGLAEVITNTLAWRNVRDKATLTAILIQSYT